MTILSMKIWVYVINQYAGMLGCYYEYYYMSDMTYLFISSLGPYFARQKNVQ